MRNMNKTNALIKLFESYYAFEQSPWSFNISDVIIYTKNYVLERAQIRNINHQIKPSIN